MGFKEISADGLDYNLFVPDEWVSDISTGVTSAYFSMTDRSNISVITSNLTNPIETLEEYWAIYEPEIKEMFSDFEYVRELEEVTLDGERALQCVYTGTKSGKKYQIMQLTAIYKGYYYIFTYTAEPEKYDEHFEDVQAILGYFDFLG